MAAGDGGHPGPLVLALLPAEPLAVHAADGHRRSRPARISPPGTCRGSSPRSTSSSPRPWPARRQLKKTPDRRVRRPAGEGHRARHATGPTLYDFLAHEALEFYTLGRAGGGQGRRRLRAGGRQPDLRPGRGVRGLGGRRRPTPSRRRVKAIRLYQDLLKFHAERRGQGGLARRRPGAAGLRLQQGGRRGEERPLQGGAEAVRRPAGATTRSRPGPGSTGPRCCSRKATWSRPTSWPSRAPRRSPTASAARCATTWSSRSRPSRPASRTERVWNEPLADDPRPLPQRDARSTSASSATTGPQRIKSGRAAARMAGREPSARRCWPQKPDLEWSAKLPATDDYQERTEEIAGAQGPEAGLLLPAGQPRSRASASRTTRSASPTSG